MSTDTEPNSPAKSNEHGYAAHGHSHGLIDRSITRSREGLRAVGISHGAGEDDPRDTRLAVVHDAHVADHDRQQRSDQRHVDDHVVQQREAGFDAKGLGGAVLPAASSVRTVSL